VTLAAARRGIRQNPSGATLGDLLANRRLVQPLAAVAASPISAAEADRAAPRDGGTAHPQLSAEKLEERRAKCFKSTPTPNGSSPPAAGLACSEIQQRRKESDLSRIGCTSSIMCRSSADNARKKLRHGGKWAPAVREASAASPANDLFILGRISSGANGRSSPPRRFADGPNGAAMNLALD